ncbi:hypothetical protein [Kitasatospora sp. NPDC050543]|uniref:hypothetical protein n=1 Tax=Kitasatospora sp. NPDC050543 TaxID=3364054 RepID=UPI003788C5FC
MSDFDEMVKGIKIHAAPKATDPQAEAFGKACATLALALPFIPLRAWLFMLGVGAAHGAVEAVPTLGFGSALLVLLGVSAVRGAK